jgi:hypothetical protein
MCGEPYITKTGQPNTTHSDQKRWLANVAAAFTDIHHFIDHQATHCHLPQLPASHTQLPARNSSLRAVTVQQQPASQRVTFCILTSMP